MSKKWSQFDPFSALTGAEEIVGLQGGANKRGALNGVFKTYFDSLYWPLGGTADLSAAVTINGNDKDLTIGTFADSLNSFNVDVNELINLRYYDTVNSMSMFIGLNGSIPTASFGVSNSSIASNFLATDEGVEVWADDGVTRSTILLAPDHFHQEIADVHIHSDGSSLLLEVDDGVDSSYISMSSTDMTAEIANDMTLAAFGDTILAGLTSLTLNSGNGDINLNAAGEFIITSSLGVRLPSFTVAGLPSAATAGRIIYVSDASPEPTPAFADGTDWRTFYDGSIIS